MYEDNNRSGYGGFEPDNGPTYHYSYNYQPDSQGPASPWPKKAKGKGTAGKAVALVLCCALVGGGAGVGGAAAYQALSGGHSGSGSTTIYQNNTPTTQVNIQQADGLTEMSLEEIYASYVDSCVNINAQTTVQQGWQQYQATSAGSGFIISQDGYIITNYHVIDGASSIQVTLNNGESYDAAYIGGEELNDVAVLKIDVTGLKPVVLGDSDSLTVGEQVSTIGNALGSYSFSQTSGYVSGVGRSVTMSDGTVMNMIQTDCTINSGNSGGPLFDQYGRVVGITSAKLSNNGDSSTASIEGIGFAIPINDVIDIITDYMEYGYVTGRPYMGILSPTDVTEQHRQTFGWPAGVYVNSVEEGSCAETAGIRPGDIITAIDDTEITGVTQLTSVKNSYRAGDTVTVTVYRSGETLELSLTFDEQTNTTQSQQEESSDPVPQQTGSGNGGQGYFNPWDYFFG